MTIVTTYFISLLRNPHNHFPTDKAKASTIDLRYSLFFQIAGILLLLVGRLFFQGYVLDNIASPHVPPAVAAEEGYIGGRD